MHDTGVPRGPARSEQSERDVPGSRSQSTTLHSVGAALETARRVNAGRLSATEAIRTALHAMSALEDALHFVSLPLVDDALT